MELSPECYEFKHETKEDCNTFSKQYYKTIGVVTSQKKTQEVTRELSYHTNRCGVTRNWVVKRDLLSIYRKYLLLSTYLFDHIKFILLFFVRNKREMKFLQRSLLETMKN